MSYLLPSLLHRLCCPRALLEGAENRDSIYISFIIKVRRLHVRTYAQPRVKPQAQAFCYDYERGKYWAWDFGHLEWKERLWIPSSSTYTKGGERANRSDTRVEKPFNALMLLRPPSSMDALDWQAGSKQEMRPPEML